MAAITKPCRQCGAPTLPHVELRRLGPFGSELPKLYSPAEKIASTPWGYMIVQTDRIEVTWRYVDAR
jgi:hypothetical protein